MKSPRIRQAGRCFKCVSVNCKEIFVSDNSHCDALTCLEELFFSQHSYHIDIIIEL